MIWQAPPSAGGLIMQDHHVHQVTRGVDNGWRQRYVSAWLHVILVLILDRTLRLERVVQQLCQVTGSCAVGRRQWSAYGSPVSLGFVVIHDGTAFAINGAIPNSPSVAASAHVRARRKLAVIPAHRPYPAPRLRTRPA